MFQQSVLRLTIMLVVLACSANAGGKDQLQQFFNEAAVKVRTVDDPSQKREILNESFDSISKALALVQRSPTLTNAERACVDRFKASIQEKKEELAGTNGYQRVPDERLNAFSEYVVQDMEQAAEYITISVVTLLLIILIIVLLV